MKALYKLCLAAACAAALSAALPAAHAEEEVRIGLVTTLTGPLAALGQHARDGFTLAVEEAGGKLGGVPVRVVVEDDQLKPEIGLQATNKLIQRDKVQILTGVIFSNVAMAVYKPAVSSGVFFISPNAGPSQLAGKMCSPYFFATAWQNDQPHEAMGIHLQQQGVGKVYLLAANYTAGKDAMEGFKRGYKGQIVGETYAGMNQLDFAAEITQIKAARPDALFAFLSGGMGVNFARQYAQAGMTAQVPLYSAFMIDAITLPAIGPAAEGTYQSNLWNADLPNPTNRAFVENFRKRWGYLPSNYAAQSYDTARLIGSALRATQGKVSDKKRFAAALRRADFESVRGPFRFNDNNFPIGNFYLIKTVKNAAGELEQVTEKTILSDAKDAYYTECKMSAM